MNCLAKRWETATRRNTPACASWLCAFSARSIDEVPPRVLEVTNVLLDAVAGQREIDLMDAVATKLPVRIVCELLGVPDEGADICRAHSRGLRTRRRLSHRNPHRPRCFREVHLIADKRAAPGDDLLGDLVCAEVDGQRLTDSELVAMTGFLLFTGHETTVQLIGNGMLALLLHPDQLGRLRDDPSLLPGAIEEFLRYDGPVNPGLPRYAMEDVEIGGAPSHEVHSS